MSGKSLLSHFIAVTSLLLQSACSSVKHSDGEPIQQQKSYFVLSLNLDNEMNFSSSDHNKEQCPVRVFLRSTKEPCNDSLIEVDYVKHQRPTIISLPPGSYFLHSIRFCVNKWTETYTPDVFMFKVLPGKMSYAGDLYIRTRIKKSEFKGSWGLLDMKLNYQMEQFVVNNPDIEKIIQETYPATFTDKPVVARTLQSILRLRGKPNT